jgi:hypothetical protein
MFAFLQVQSAPTKWLSAIRPVQVWYEPVPLVPGTVTMGPLPEQMSEALEEVVPLPDPPPLPLPVELLLLPAVPPWGLVLACMALSSTPHAAEKIAAALAARIQCIVCFMMRDPF